MLLSMKLPGWLALVIILGFLIIYIKLTESRSLFYPEAKIEYLPTGVGLDFEEIYFRPPDNLELNGWFLPAKDKSYFTILFCHGNAGNISHRIDKLLFFNQLGYNVFIFDYRGYGRSKGRPSEKGVYWDTFAAYNYLLSRGITPEEIIGYGESLGGAAIIDLAGHNKLKALITEGVFTCVKDMAKSVYPFLPRWIFSGRFDSLSKIKSVSIPKLIIHSSDDEIVPYKLAQKLFEAAAKPKKFLTVQGGHNICFFDSEKIIRAEIKGFIDGL